MKKTLLLLLLASLFLVFVACASQPEGNSQTGVELTSADSSDGTYRMTLYQCKQDGKKYIRGELTTLSSGETKNIFWDIYSTEIAIEWIDDVTVKVNGRSLNVTTDVYDCREVE